MRVLLSLAALTAIGVLCVLGRDGLAPERSGGVVHAADTAELGIDEVMLVVHGPKGLRSQIQEGVTGSGPADDKAWKALQARAATIVYLGEAILAKAKPEKGDAASWKTKMGEYNGQARALASAVDGKDSAAIKSSLGKIAKSCEGCHKAHR